MISAVPSVLPSSTTRISKFSRIPRSTSAVRGTTCARLGPSLKAGMITVIPTTAASSRPPSGERVVVTRARADGFQIGHLLVQGRRRAGTVTILDAARAGSTHARHLNDLPLGPWALFCRRRRDHRVGATAGPLADPRDARCRRGGDHRARVRLRLPATGIDGGRPRVRRDRDPARARPVAAARAQRARAAAGGAARRVRPLARRVARARARRRRRHAAAHPGVLARLPDHDRVGDRGRVGALGPLGVADRQPADRLESPGGHRPADRELLGDAARARRGLRVPDRPRLDPDRSPDLPGGAAGRRPGGADRAVRLGRVPGGDHSAPDPRRGRRWCWRRRSLRPSSSCRSWRTT